MILTSNQIAKRVLRMRRQRYSAEDENNLIYIIHKQTLGIDSITESEFAMIEAFKEYAVACSVFGEQLSIKSDLESRTLAYTKAVNRLKKYKLEDGREETIVAPILDEFENIIEEGYTIKGIEPVTPLMIEQNIYDDEGEITGTEEVVNHIIQKDRDEREAATLIVNLGEPK